MWLSAKKRPLTSNVTQSRAEARSSLLLSSVSVYVLTITCLLSWRVKLKSESSAKAAWLRADDKSSANFLGNVNVKKKWRRELSCWLWWVFKKWFTLLNVWPTFCWDGAISITRWPDKKPVRSMQHSSLGLHWLPDLYCVDKSCK